MLSPLPWWKTGTKCALVLATFTLLSLPPPSLAADEGEGSLFEDLNSLKDAELADNSGGTQLNLGDMGLNIASNSAEVSGNTVSGNTNTGQISNNSLNDVSGINSLMFNTGNNVNFQNNMQINIFLK